MQQPLSEDQWKYVKKIKDEIRDNKLNCSSVVIRTVSQGAMISGFDPSIWEDNYNADTFADTLISGEFFDVVGKNLKYVEGGKFELADAQFLTHYNHKTKFENTQEVWHGHTYISGTYLPEYISGTNLFVSGNVYEIMGIKVLPYEYEINLYMKLKK
jgi:hypothetical protein